MLRYFDTFPNSSILLAGCGGGYDCFTAIPLYLSLKHRVYLANLSFTNRDYLNLFPRINNTSCYDITYTGTLPEDVYFPEYWMAKYLNIHVYAFVDEGMGEYLKGYTALVDYLGIDIIILADGGCDSILTGTEQHLATPVEDVMSMLTVVRLTQFHDKPIRAYLLLLGATVDTFGEINRDDFLTNLAQLDQSNILLEQVKLTLSPAVMTYKHVFEQCHPWRSIVNASICARLDGCSGQVLPPLLVHNEIPRCSNEHFILDDYLITYYLFTLPEVVERIKYIPLIQCDDSDDIDAVIMDFNASLWP